MEKTIIIRVFGIVQGVGFRPTVSRHAAKYRIRGTVSNTGPYVEILAAGREEDVDAFTLAIREEPPERAVILRMDVEEAGGLETGPGFEIIESEKKRGDIFVSPDIAICEKCKKELYDPEDRRYLHPFINCTCCGPRLTILDAMPYDRVRTSMAGFPMCKSCHEEYTSPDSRRYDAQPVCCNECGPEVYLIGREERRAEAIHYVRRVIREGGIAAVKGIGGFHLCCDAKNPEAVSLLRTRKHRPMKPFAVMMKDLETAERECIVPAEAREELDGHQKPIILLERKQGGSVCEETAPDNPKLGVMLPYTPLHCLLFDYPGEEPLSDCLVMTSANRSGAPICRDDRDAVRELTHLCDVILSHDRLIRIRADDTVMDYTEEGLYMIRRSRGYAPLPVMLRGSYRKEVLAVGGELKNTFCIGKGGLLYPSPYIGDMTDVRTVEALAESVRRMEELLEAKPSVVACDLHPGYNTTAFAATLDLPILRVQHHYAHVLSCMAENDHEGPVIGVSFDGTGYGTDGTIWGGEILIADYHTFDRWGSLEPFPQTGGDLSAREGWRIAAGLARQIYGAEEGMKTVRDLQICSPEEARMTFVMAERGINTVTSTSAGRLFDAASSILGIRSRSTFEGEASVALQFAAQRGEKAARLDLGDFAIKKEGDRYLLPGGQLIREITERKRLGEDRDRLAFAFHRDLARMIADACLMASEETGIKDVVLTGGVYQNTLLLKYSKRYLEEKGLKVLTHRMIPPNDGGICLGQAVYALHNT